MYFLNKVKKNDLLLICAISVSTLLMCSVPSQIAHAHQIELFNIGGKDYLFVVGSVNEPVFVDDKSGVDFFAYAPDHKDPTDSFANGTKPISGLEKTLKVEVTAGPKKKVFDFVPKFKDPGHYNAPFYPTVQTTYQYLIFGTIDNVNVSLPFICSPGIAEEGKSDNATVKISDEVIRKDIKGGFGCPQSRSDVAFPETYLSNIDIQNKLDHSTTTTHTNSLPSVNTTTIKK